MATEALEETEVDDVCDSWEEMDENGHTQVLQYIDTIKVHLDKVYQRCFDRDKTDQSALGRRSPIKVELGRHCIHTVVLTQGCVPIACFAAISANHKLSPHLDQLTFLQPPPPIRPSLCKVDILADENPTLGTQYMMPEPAIRILKRPETRGDGQLNGESARRPVKTLEQRQREYEEARLRILGEARSPEDVIDENLGRLQDKLQASSISERVRVKERASPPAATERGVVTLARRSPPPGVLVLRAPRAPDGTRGFNAAR